MIGAGTNRMNIYTVAKASQGLANYVNERFPEGNGASQSAMIPGSNPACLPKLPPVFLRQTEFKSIFIRN